MTSQTMVSEGSSPVNNDLPRESYVRLFLRFLRFGFLAWGGPVAQIAMIRQELVDEERWISNERFNRVLAVYQILPGPEAHELCVYFGMLSRGRLGGLVAGLGFMLPGLLLMLLLSWVYVTYGIALPLFAAAFFGMQAGVGALIVRAVHRIGSHALDNQWLWIIAILAACAQLVGINFLIILSIAGVSYVLFVRRYIRWGIALGVVAVVAILLVGMSLFTSESGISAPTNIAVQGAPSAVSLFGSGLRSGLLTFGGAYTVIPYLRHDAVEAGGWMSSSQFLDGLALSGILPAPLVIFGTFVGYLGGGLIGALALTIGIFLPAFGFTLMGHEFLERIVENKALHSFLDGVTAGVVGLIAATTIFLLQDAITSWAAVIIFAAALTVLFRWKSKASVPIVVLGAAVTGVIVSLF